MAAFITEPSTHLARSQSWGKSRGSWGKSRGSQRSCRPACCLPPTREASSSAARSTSYHEVQFYVHIMSVNLAAASLHLPGLKPIFLGVSYTQNHTAEGILGNTVPASTKQTRPPWIASAGPLQLL